jgi:hypothetical protein
MNWNEVTTIKLEGNILAMKDAMIMLSEDENSPEWPFINCDPGEYVFEINVPTPFFAHRARIRKIGSKPEHGKEIGSVNVDHAFLGVIDYEKFLSEVKKDYEEYSDWTAMELDDKLSISFSGEINFNEAKLLYVKSGDGDGTYKCIELLQNGSQVGIECVFIS